LKILELAPEVVGGVVGKRVTYKKPTNRIERWVFYHGVARNGSRLLFEKGV